MTLYEIGRSLVTGLLLVGIAASGAYIAAVITVWVLACHFGTMCS